MRWQVSRTPAACLSVARTVCAYTATEHAADRACVAAVAVRPTAKRMTSPALMKEW